MSSGLGSLTGNVAYLTILSFSLYTRIRWSSSNRLTLKFVPQNINYYTFCSVYNQGMILRLYGTSFTSHSSRTRSWWWTTLWIMDKAGPRCCTAMSEVTFGGQLGVNRWAQREVFKEPVALAAQMDGDSGLRSRRAAGARHHTGSRARTQRGGRRGEERQSSPPDGRTSHALCCSRGDVVGGRSVGDWRARQTGEGYNSPAWMSPSATGRACEVGVRQTGPF